MIQYSVSTDWRSKIWATIRRLKKNFPDLRELVYVTNRSIGPDADDLKRRARVDNGIAVDVRDKNWFIERELTHIQRKVAAEELIEQFVAPLLRARGVASEVSTSLSDDDARVALLHLALDDADRATDKSLTKQCFEALVLSVLHDTNAESMIDLDTIVLRVTKLLPAGHDQQIRGQTKSAIKRLSHPKNGRVKEHRLKSKFHLSFDEQGRLSAQTAAFLADQVELERELLASLMAVGVDPGVVDRTHGLGTVLREALETALLQQGNLFAQAAINKEIRLMSADGIIQQFRSRIPAITSAVSPEQCVAAVLDVVESPGQQVVAHLGRIGDAYTLFSFMQQTPDVQKIILKIFSEGEIWIDTSYILPLFVETLAFETYDRPHSNILAAAVQSGFKLFVTDGVIEEIETHLKNSRSCAESKGQWRARTPYILAKYLETGAASTGFRAWVEEFRGDSRPADDVREYLEQNFNINRRNLLEYANMAPIELRAAVQEIWATAHDKRRAPTKSHMYSAVNARLVAHDVENTVGVLQLRKDTPISPLGYKQWWLTLDKSAYRVGDALKSALGVGAPRSPALNPGFLAQILRLGRTRNAVERSLYVSMPILNDFSTLNYTPSGLVDRADQIRAEHVAKKEHVVKRLVRDKLDEMKALSRPEFLDVSIDEELAEVEVLGG